MEDGVQKITIVPYDPAWPRLFQIEKDIIADALDHLQPSIEHVGSTSVEGLGATYYELKVALSQKEWDDRNDYTEAKSEFY